MLVLGLAAFAGIFAIMAFMRKSSEKIVGFGKTPVAIVFAVIAILLVAVHYGALSQWVAPNSLSVTPSGAVSTVSGTQVIAGYQPTATFTAKDKYAALAILGTSYYKTGSLAASTTAVSNTNPGETYTYWVSNTSYWVTPVTKVATSGVTPFEAQGFANGTATMTLYDLVNRQSVSSNGAYNTSMGANKQANIEVTYQGTAKASAAPFGGVFVVEYNSSINSVSCTGDDLLSSNPYQLTYTVTATSNTYKTYAFGSTLDDGTGSVKKIVCQFNNGATAAGNGSPYYFKFIQANYYVSQNGNILLDTEKAADSSSTRTALTNPLTVSALWGT